MSYEEWCENHKVLENTVSRGIWRADALGRFERIKASNHYHNGVPCREFHAFPNMELPS
jgi:hypothetical protein